LTARYTSPQGHVGVGPQQKKNTLPGPSRVPAAGSGASRSPGSSNLNRRSQSFNSIDKNKPLQYVSGNDRAVRGIPVPSGMNGGNISGAVPTSLSGQQLASAIPSPPGGKSWRSKSMNLKHSATSSMLASPTHSTSTNHPPPAADALQSHGSDGSKLGVGVGGGGPQRSMLDKFRLINPRSASRASPSVAEMALQEEDDLSEYGEDGATPPGLVCSSAAVKQTPTRTPPSSLNPPSKTSSPSSSFSKSSANSGRTAAPPKDKEDRSRSGKSSKDNSPSKDETFVDSNKKTSKIASLIPKGGKPSSGKKDGGPAPASSGIPKPGLKAPSATTTAKPQGQSQTPGQSALNSSGNMRGGEGEKGNKLTKGGSVYMQRSIGSPEGKRTSLTSSTSTSALSTFSENDCTMMVPADPCLSPTKGELVYSKTAKQCLEEISEDPETRRMRTVKNIADLRQNLEETMSSLRGTQISHR
uniref:Neuron navigator 3 n=1 Tax=Cynoglossus semilaevis TaxID=244447 RepID=A0A3P8WS63_CYNSE